MTLSAIAAPLANDKLSKKLLKLVKKSAKEKKVKRGVKEVVKAIRKKAGGCVACALRVFCAVGRRGRPLRRRSARRRLGSPQRSYGGLCLPRRPHRDPPRRLLILFRPWFHLARSPPNLSV